MAQATAMSLGAAAGGIVAGTAGAGWALAVDATSFLASGALVATIRTSPQLRAESATLLRDLIDGFREFTSHTWLWTIVLQFTVMLMGWFGATAVVGPVVANVSLGGAASWGAIAGAQGLGLIAGAVALRVRFPRPMLAATLGCLPGALIAVPDRPARSARRRCRLPVGHRLRVFNVQWNTALPRGSRPGARASRLRRARLDRDGARQRGTRGLGRGQPGRAHDARLVLRGDRRAPQPCLRPGRAPARAAWAGDEEYPP
jgi:hypothetical protein